MKSSRSAKALTRPSSRLAPSEGLVRSWVRFWFTPVEPIGLHVMRLFSGLLFLSFLLPLAGDLNSLVGMHGWFDRRAYNELAGSDDAPFLSLGWSALYVFGSNPETLRTVYWCSVAVIVLFTLGVAPRVTAVLTWVIIGSFTWNPGTYFEGDVLIRIIAFYLMIGYLLLGLRDEKQSWVTRVLGPMWFLRRWIDRDADLSRPSLGAGLALRVMQIHFAIVIVASGLHKLQFGDWWAGTALWFPLYPPYETSLADAQAHVRNRETYLGFISLATYATLIWQIGFPLYAWRPRWRPVLIGGALIGWLWTALNYRLPLVGPAIVIGCLSFVTAAEWYWLLGWLSRIPGLHVLARLLPSNEEEEQVPGIRRDEGTAAGRPDTRISRSESIVSRTSGG